MHATLAAGAFELDPVLALDRGGFVPVEGYHDIGLAVVLAGAAFEVGVLHREGARDRAIAAIDEHRAVFLAALEEGHQCLDRGGIVAGHVQVVQAAVRRDDDRVGGQRPRRGDLEAGDRGCQQRAHRLILCAGSAAPRARGIRLDRYGGCPDRGGAIHRADGATVAVIRFEAAIRQQFGGAHIARERKAAGIGHAGHRARSPTGRAVDERTAGRRARNDPAQRIKAERARHARVAMVRYHHHVGGRIEALRLQRRHQFAQPRILRAQPRARIGGARPVSVALLGLRSCGRITFDANMQLSFEHLSNGVILTSSSSPGSPAFCYRWLGGVKPLRADTRPRPNERACQWRSGIGGARARLGRLARNARSLGDLVLTILRCKPHCSA